MYRNPNVAGLILSEACQGVWLRPEACREAVFYAVEGSLQGFLGFEGGFGFAFDDAAAGPVTHLPGPPSNCWAVDQGSGQVAA